MLMNPISAPVRPRLEASSVYTGTYSMRIQHTNPAVVHAQSPGGHQNTPIEHWNRCCLQVTGRMGRPSDSQQLVKSSKTELGPVHMVWCLGIRPEEPPTFFKWMGFIRNWAVGCQTHRKRWKIFLTNRLRFLITLNKQTPTHGSLIHSAPFAADHSCLTYPTHFVTTSLRSPTITWSASSFHVTFMAPWHSSIHGCTWCTSQRAGNSMRTSGPSSQEENGGRASPQPLIRAAVLKITTTERFSV